MDIEKQVCSLDQSRRLSLLGISKESYFYYTGSVGLNVPFKLTSTYYAYSEMSGFYYDCRLPAFTATELGIMIQDFAEYAFFNEKSGKWGVLLVKNDTQFLDEVFGDTEAEARADALIYLLTNSHLDISKVNDLLKAS